MANLVVGGVTIPLALATPPSRTTREGGDFAPTFDGGEMGVIVSRKRVWTFVTTPIPIASIDDLEDAIIATPPVSCSGTILGATISMRGTITGYEYVSARSGPYVVLTFTLSEQ